MSETRVSVRNGSREETSATSPPLDPATSTDTPPTWNSLRCVAPSIRSNSGSACPTSLRILDPALSLHHAPATEIPTIQCCCRTAPYNSPCPDLLLRKSCNDREPPPPAEG